MTDPLDDLETRLKTLKKEVSPPPPPKEEDGKNDLGRAYELIAIPVVAGGIGVGMDRLFSTSPFFFITLAILGVLAGFWAIYKADHMTSSKDAGKNPVSSQNIATSTPLKRLQEDEKQAKTGANLNEDQAE